MASFRSVNWTDEDDITAEKLNQMSSNDQYLLQRSIPAIYRAHGLNKNTGIKIAAGIAVVPPTTEWWSGATVHFNGFFSVGCKPIITCTPANGIHHQIETAILSHTYGNGVPTEQGFTVVVSNRTSSYPALKYMTHVHWHAIGY